MLIKEASSTFSLSLFFFFFFFFVFGMTLSGIEPWSPGPLTNTNQYANGLVCVCVITLNAEEKYDYLFHLKIFRKCKWQPW